MSAERPVFGVLALQGDFAAHARVLSGLGVEVRQVRRPDQLAGLGGLVLPGGESTTLLKLMAGSGLEESLRAFHAGGGVLFGTCAGMILLARKVTGPEQRSLGLVDVDVARNAYGRQIDSFEADAEWTAPEVLEPVAPTGGSHGAEGGGDPPPLPLVFIRAPRLTRLGPGVEPLVRCRGDVVMARQERVVVAAFHPEISGDDRLHRYVVGLAAGAPVQARSRPVP